MTMDRVFDNLSLQEAIHYDEEQRLKAAKTIACMAQSIEDAKELLGMLGLLHDLQHLRSSSRYGRTKVT